MNTKDSLPGLPCLICEGATRWHRDGSPCDPKSTLEWEAKCDREHIKCKLCKGSGRVSVA
jgi:hypothetical protein